MNSGSVCYWLSLILSLIFFGFLSYGEPWTLDNLSNIVAIGLAFFTGIFVRNKFYNFVMVFIIACAAYELYNYSIKFGFDIKSSTQIKNEAVIVGIFAMVGWLLTATYFLWQAGNRLAHWKAKPPNVS